MSEQAPLLRVCSLLNKHGAQYLVVGARACWLHGYVRATMDVDILIPEDLENHARVIAALSELEDHAAAELTATGSGRKRRCEGCRRSGSRREYSRLESELCRCDWHIAKGDNRRRGSSLRRFTNFDQEQKH